MAEEYTNQVQAEETAESTLNIDQNKYVVINAPNAEKIISVHEDGGQEGLLPAGGATGQVVTKKSDKDFDVEWTDASSGVVDYAELENKPSINNVVLNGNKTSSELGLQSKIVKEKSNDPSNGIFSFFIDDASSAISVVFKGNSFPFWQLISSDPSTLVTTQPGRYYYSYINGVENILVSTGETIQGSASNGDLVYDLTYSRFTSDEIVDLETFKEAWYKKSGSPFTNKCPFTDTYDSGAPEIYNNYSGVHIIGRNLFDEQTVRGEGATEWFAQNPIPVEPNTAYYVTSPYVINYEWMDMRADEPISGGTVQNAEITPPSAAGGLRLWCDDHRYEGGVCVNISDPDFNGTYEPFEEIGDITCNAALFSIEDVKDSIEINATTSTVTHRIGQREYQKGDEYDTSVITDGTTTYYVLSEPEVESVDYVEISPVILSDGYNTIINVSDIPGELSIKYYDKDFEIPAGDSDINILDFTESPLVGTAEVQTAISNGKPTFIKYVHNNNPNYALLTLNQSPDGSPIAISYVSYPNMDLDLIQLSTLEYVEQEDAIAFNDRYVLYPLGMHPVQVSTGGGTLTREQYSKLSYGVDAGSAQVVDESNFIYRLCHADSGYYEFSCSYSTASGDYLIRTIKLNTQTLQYTYTIQGYFAE